AYAWRSRFHKDILVELVGYRRWGHNEGDEPAFTQPRMYAVIRAHPTVRALYAQQLERERVVAPGAAEEMLKAVWTRLDQAKKQAEQGQAPAPVMETGAANGHYERFTP